MKLRISGAFILCFFIFYSEALIAQASVEGEFSILQLQNLPQNDVNRIFEDSKGFLWFGTLDGLHRYDGYSYKTYRISDSPGSISSNLIISIDEDSKGNLWIGTYGKGICKLDPVSDKFTNFNNWVHEELPVELDDVTDMVIDSRDIVWLCNWFGLFRIKLNKKATKIEELTIFSLEDFGIGNQEEYIKRLHVDREGEIWIGTNINTIHLTKPYVDKNEIEFEVFNIQGEVIYEYEDGLLAGGSNIYAIQKDISEEYHTELISSIPNTALLYKNQKIWLGNRNGITSLKYTPDKNWEVEHQINTEGTSEYINSNIVTCMLEDKLGQIWVGTRAGGVYVINLRPKKFYHYNSNNTPGSVSSNFIQCVFEDRNENLWIGTEDRGISFLSKRRTGRYNDGFQQVLVNATPQENRAYCIEETLIPSSNGERSYIWVGTSHFENLAKIDPRTLEKKTLSAPLENLGFVFALENMGDTVLWTGTYGRGISKIHLDNNGNIYSSDLLVPEGDAPNKLASYIVRDIHLDRENNLFVATDKGLSILPEDELHKKNPRFINISKGYGPEYLSQDYLLDIFESYDGRIWIGTMGGGLILCEKNIEGHDFYFSTISEGLPNNTVKSILEDKRGFLWLATNKGLARYDTQNGEIVNYDSEDGLQNDEFSEICAYYRANGQMVFGGINGFNVFYPEQIGLDTIKPKMVLTDFYLLNDIIQPGQEIDGHVVLEKSIEYTEEITLKHSQNSFSIGFLGLNYKDPQKNKYEYMLDGFDNKWYKATAAYRIAKYTNVPAGEYTFLVKGSNSDNIWNEAPASIKIMVRPHFLLSPLAYAIYLLILVASGAIAYRLILRNSERKKKLLVAQVERKNAEELTQTKLRFFTNISHEFRTPLTLITAPLEKLIDQNEELSSEERMKKYAIIRQNSSLLLRLVNQLMDFRRMDQDKMKLKPEKGELNAFIYNIFQSFEPLAEQNNISYNFSPASKDIELWFDADKLEKVIYNLLSNAFKFTPNDGSININIKESSEVASIHVSDTGIGIEEKDQKHIFERFFQPDKKDRKNTGGTGIGLAFSKGLIDLHKGDINVFSNKGKGTTFKVNLNKGEDWFSNTNLEENKTAVTQKSKTSAANITETNPTSSDTTTSSASDIKFEDHTSAESLEIKAPPGKKVLIIEDNNDLRSVLIDLLQDDFEVFDAEDGAKGLKSCLKNQPDVIISDIMMPVMDGIEMCNRLKNDEEVSHIPILLLTAKSTEEAQIEGYQTGADAYMPKPFNAKLLRTQVISLLWNRENMKNRFQKEIEINPMIISNSPADAKFLDQILKIIEDNLSNSEFTIEELAETYGVSRIYLNRKIKALTGETSNQFLRNIRLKHAAELLKQGVLTVSEVTWMVGYNDLRTFRTRFKDKFGVSPSEYVKQNKAE